MGETPGQARESQLPLDALDDPVRQRDVEPDGIA
jgi:hypothetical protein